MSKLMESIKRRLNASADVEVTLQVNEDNRESVEAILEEMGATLSSDDGSTDDKIVVLLPEDKLESFMATMSEDFDDVVVEAKEESDDDSNDDDDDKDDKDSKNEGDDDSDDDDKDSDDKDDDKDDKKKKNPFDKKDVKESLKKVIDGVELDEDVKDELVTLFMGAIEGRSTEIADASIAEMEEGFKAELDTIHENVGKYLSYVAKEWMTENEIQVENGLKIEFAESLISNIKGVFDENYVEIPEDKIDLVDEMESINTSMKDELDEAKTQIIELQTSINEGASQTIVSKVASDLTETQQEKFSEMVTNSIEFVDEDDYKSKVELLKAKFFTEDADDTDDNDDNDDLNEDDNSSSSRVKRYSRALKHTSFKK